MLKILGSGDLSTNAYRTRPYPESPVTVAALTGCVSMCIMRDAPAYTTTSGGFISAVINLANGSNNFVQATSGRQPAMTQNDVLGRKTAQFLPDYTSYMTAQSTINYTTPHTMFAVVSAAHDPAKVFQAIIGRYNAAAPERSAIVLRDNGNMAAMYGDAVPLPSASYRSARWGLVMMSYDGTNKVSFRMGNSGWFTATATVEPSIATDVLNLGFSASGGATLNGFMDMAGVFNIDLSAPSNSTTLRKVLDMVSNQYGSIVPICGR